MISAPVRKPDKPHQELTSRRQVDNRLLDFPKIWISAESGWSSSQRSGDHPGFLLKLASRLVSGGWVELKIYDCKCHYRAFQLKLDILGTKNFETGSVVKKLQIFEVGAKSHFIFL